MEWFIENWYVIVAILAGIAAFVGAVIAFFKLPVAAQRDRIRQWLLWGVSLAEQKFGGGTGQLKLREVYDKFITKFPFISKIISFQAFSNLVDDALVDMKEMLDKNDNINNIISNNKGQ